MRPDLPQVACFDTAFHATMPPAASTYALPGCSWRERSACAASASTASATPGPAVRAAELLGRPVEGLRLVTAHLGARGASLAAVAGGRSVDTTMGFTPSRAWSWPPGLGLASIPGPDAAWPATHGLGPDELEDALEHRRSGLLGLSGIGRPAPGAGRRPTPATTLGPLAYGVYVHRLATSVAAMAAAMGGLDGLVFTGGAGERSHRLRADACATWATWAWPSSWRSPRTP